MEATYKYERPFRLKILALLIDNVWLARYGADLIKPEYFEQEDEEAIARGVIDYRKSYGHAPSDPDDLIALIGPIYANLVCRIYDMREEANFELATDLVVGFAREQAVKLAIIESVDDINKQDYHAPIERLRKALDVGSTISSPGIDPIADVDQWLYNYWTDKVPTGLIHLDSILDGGLSVPEIGLILAPPNRGKSMTLVNIGVGAAGLSSKRNVVHFTHEMKPAQVAKRYAARMVFRFPQKSDNLDDYAEELVDAARKMVPGKIRIIGGAEKMTTLEVEAHLDKLVAEGFEPGLIIDDYPALMVPPQTYKERRFELSSTLTWWRGVSERYNCPVWGAAQGNRGSLSKEIVTMQDIAEDFEMCAIADTIVALCQTFEEEQNDQCRLFIAKLRDAGRKSPLIACKYYGASQAIITTGIVQRKEDEAEV